MAKRSFKLEYHGSLFWLIFWVIVFFPVALVLLLTGFTLDLNDKKYTVQYGGSRFWLGFWVIFFFPIAFLLLFLKGLSLRSEDEITSEIKQ